MDDALAAAANDKARRDPNSRPGKRRRIYRADNFEFQVGVRRYTSAKANIFFAAENAPLVRDEFDRNYHQ